MSDKIIIDRGLIDTKFTIISPTQVDVERFQDVEPILNHNKALQNDADFNNGYTPSRDMQHVASIPLILMEQWWRELNKGKPRKDWYGVHSKEMAEFVRAKLNDKDNAFVRTGQGQV